MLEELPVEARYILIAYAERDLGDGLVGQEQQLLGTAQLAGLDILARRLAQHLMKLPPHRRRQS